MKAILGLSVLAAATTAGAASDRDVVGRWIHVRYPSLRVEVTPNGGDFVVSVLKESTSNKYVGHLKGGVLVVSVGPLETKVDVDAKTGHLLLNGQEYRHLKDGESFDYQPKGQPKGW